MARLEFQNFELGAPRIRRFQSKRASVWLRPNLKTINSGNSSWKMSAILLDCHLTPIHNRSLFFHLSIEIAVSIPAVILYGHQWTTERLPILLIPDRPVRIDSDSWYNIALEIPQTNLNVRIIRVIY